MNEPAIFYAGGHLDRAAEQRQDPHWVAARLARPSTRIVPVWRDRNLIDGFEAASPRPIAVMPRGADAARIIDRASEITFLGLDGDGAVFAADLSAFEQAPALDLAGGGAFVDLRKTGPLMAAGEGALLAYARGLLHWHRQQHFCSRCGQSTESRHGGHMRACANPACGRETFPRIDPAVIMLIEYVPPDGTPPLCLLGHHVRMPSGAYSTLAGFVEPGESLEEAVAREVLEEVGVRVTEVRYQGSQPWPFPSSIMLGFRARAENTVITLDENELADARWFTAAELRAFGEWGDPDVALRIPRRDSIARFLVDTWWLNEQT